MQSNFLVKLIFQMVILYLVFVTMNYYPSTTHDEKTLHLPGTDPWFTDRA
jgi:hypothetical protein